MNIALKRFLIDKVAYGSINNRELSEYFRIVRINYKHNENKYVFSISHSTNTDDESVNMLKNTEPEAVYNVHKDIFIKNVLENIKSKPQDNSKRRKVIIDFSSPNIAKPFHAGHLRSTIIGNFIANINKHYNNDVTKINYLGDWGTQFGLLQYGMKLKNININDLTLNPIRNLYDIYVDINKLSSTNESVQQQARKYFSDIEQGKADLGNWSKIREMTVKELEMVYQRLGITFDEYHWESDYNGGVIQETIKLLEQMGIIKTDEVGKKVAKYNNRDVTVLKSDNSTLYLSRDIAALLDRYEKYRFDEMLYVVDNSQTDHFAAVFDIVKHIEPNCAAGCEHIKFGRIKGMSTRSGNVVFLNDILDEAKNKMYDKQQKSKNTRSSAINEATCDILGTTAVLINDLKQRRHKDYVFDWNKALQSEGDSGIKLQYLHCRLWSLEKNCGVSIPETCEPKYLKEEIIGDVVAELTKFNDILLRAKNENEACIIVNYLFRLARHVNRMFNELKVKDVETDLAQQRLLVFHSARFIVKTCLEILGVKVLYAM